MTSSDMPSRLYIPQPFASGTGAALTPIDLTTGSTPNFVDGFPSQFSSPKSGGGSYITRGQMNAIGNLASVNQYCDACGGVVTFDPALATKIGGYPAGAILEWVNGTVYNKVISLADNNMYDFRGITDTTTYPSVINGSIDGVHWAYAISTGDSVSDPITLAEVDLGEVDAVSQLTAITMNAASFVVPRNGAVSAFLTLGEMVVPETSPGVYTYTATMYCKAPSASTSTSYTLVSNSSASSSAMEAVRISAGTLCSIILAFGNVHFKSVKLKVTIV